eukprot:jgi/Bigna1/38618/e_gw1.27.106.1
MSSSSQPSSLQAGNQASTGASILQSELPTVVAGWDYKRRSPQELSFSRGDVIEVHGKYDEVWWKGQIGDKVGYFAAQYVSGLDEVEVEEDNDDSGDVDLQDDEYFGEYSGLKIHLEMLSDFPRTKGYQSAIHSLRHEIADRSVLDLGCGSGILSIFAAKAGAKVIYAVDASDILVKATKKVVEANGFADKIVLVKTKMEDMKLPVAKVDVIVSEWMGTFLIAEAMLESVIIARNRFLRKDGLMMPSYAQLQVAPATDPTYWDEKVNFWRSVHEVDMSPLIEMAKDEFFRRPCQRRVLKPEQLLAAPMTVWRMDMYEVQIADLNSHASRFAFAILKAGMLHCIGAWFDVAFMAQRSHESSTWLSTSPHHPATHWKHALLFFKEPHTVQVGDKVTGLLKITRNQSFRRHFHIELTASLHRKKQKQTSCASKTPKDTDGKEENDREAEQEEVVLAKNVKYFMWR